jgi:Cu-Zn family superoxide dismutase
MNAISYAAALALFAGVGMLAMISRSSAQMALPVPAAAAPAPESRAVAVIVPTKGNSISGTLWFDTTPDGLHIHGTVSGLDPNSKHGFHVHDFGDLTSDDGMAAGGHYNPDKMPHGGPMSPMHMAGDLGNITADEKGVATVDITTKDMSVSGVHPIVGRSVVVHLKEDEMTPTAPNSARIGVGVIGYAKPQ